MQQDVIKIIDDKGRVLIPKEMREMIDLTQGDVIKLKVVDNELHLYKVAVVDYKDSSQSDAMSVALNALSTLDASTKMKIVQSILKQMKGM